MPPSRESRITNDPSLQKRVRYTAEAQVDNEKPRRSQGVRIKYFSEIRQETKLMKMILIDLIGDLKFIQYTVYAMFYKQFISD